MYKELFSMTSNLIISLISMTKVTTLSSTSHFLKTANVFKMIGMSSSAAALRSTAPPTTDGHAATRCYCLQRPLILNAGERLGAPLDRRDLLVRK